MSNFTHLRLYAGCQGLDDLVDRKWSGWWRTFLVLVTPAWWSGYYCSGWGGVQPLTVCVLVQRCVPRLRLVLPHHEPGQRQVLDWWDSKPVTGLEDRFVSYWFSAALMTKIGAHWLNLSVEFFWCSHFPSLCHTCLHFHYSLPTFPRMPR